jgi:hypothetical protein
VLLAMSFAKQLILSHTRVSDLRFRTGCIGAFESVPGEVSVGVRATAVSTWHPWLVLQKYCQLQLSCPLHT